ERALLPTASFPRSDLQFTINQSGELKDLFYENENFTHTNSMNRSPLRCGLFLIALLLACFGLSPAAQAVDPPPDGGYPNQNTAEGEDALFSLGIGFNNTAVGFHALFSNTNGNDNTAVGYGALYQNISGDFNTASGFQALYFNTTGKRN